MDRLIRNAGLPGILAGTIRHLGIIHPASLVNCDHSTFNGLAAFVGAIQTKKGRAVPCLVATTYDHNLPAHADAPKRKQQMRAARQDLEETFKDLKHVLDLVRTRLMKPVSLELLLWFTGLSFILGYLSGLRNTARSR